MEILRGRYTYIIVKNESNKNEIQVFRKYGLDTIMNNILDQKYTVCGFYLNILLFVKFEDHHYMYFNMLLNLKS